MSKFKWKLMLAGLVVASAFGGITIGIAWATPGSGASFITIAGPVVLDEIDVKFETDTYELEIKTEGLSDALVRNYTIVPGGHTGWHSHPGAVLVMITAGTMTKEEADGTTAVYPAGTGFVEPGGAVHIARNLGDSDLKLTAFFLIPAFAAPGTSEPAPY